MNNKLKIGQSFEVVEVLRDVGSAKLKGNCGIVVHKGSYVDVVCNGSWHKTSWQTEGFYTFQCTVALMTDSEIKPIGKLTITKLK